MKIREKERKKERKNKVDMSKTYLKKVRGSNSSKPNSERGDKNLTVTIL